MTTRSPWFEGCFDFDGIAVHARIGGRMDAPPLLLLRGFPRVLVMWHRVAPVNGRAVVRDGRLATVGLPRHVERHNRLAAGLLTD